MNNVNHILGVHQGRIDAHDVAIRDIKDEFKTVNVKLDDIQDTLNQRKGAGALIKWFAAIGLPILGFITGKGTH